MYDGVLFMAATFNMRTADIITRKSFVALCAECCVDLTDPVEAKTKRGARKKLIRQAKLYGASEVDGAWYCEECAPIPKEEMILVSYK